jgi:hypothetical protein
MFRALHENFILPDCVKHSSLLHKDMRYALKNLITADILTTELVLKFQGFLNLTCLILYLKISTIFFSKKLKFRLDSQNFLPATKRKLSSFEKMVLTKLFYLSYFA